ncbi:MAG: hypothetical protein A2Z07_05315 [Armatimonadetes bacterium RBG_16_67_12]|nr:MAG: hypothetical protein A2Z07_05315 [Armatimonadetes bacterium RBG_16_67_12]
MVSDGDQGATEMKRLAGAIAVLLTISVLAQVRAEAAILIQTVRSLAENTLGTGTVKSVRTVDVGATVLISWESVTYKAANSAAATRELLYAEAALATGAVMGPLQDVRRIRFTIQKGDRTLATGEVWRVRSLTLAFADELGGGTYKAAESKTKPVAPGGDASMAQ